MALAIPSHCWEVKPMQPKTERWTMAWRTRKETGPTIDKIENIVGPSCLVRGDLIAEGAFRIDGAVVGSVDTKASVVIGESGSVTGNVKGADVVVAGRVHGNVTCSGHLEIVGEGSIDGDIDVKSLRIETGGRFAGTSRMNGKVSESEKEADTSSVLKQLTAV
jgi:cytoskeletal protein CcmA (bactofilin family)